jgi:hypothetical protein
MARQVRVEYPGAIYQVMNRGDRREPIFRDDRDWDDLLTLLGEAELVAHAKGHPEKLKLAAPLREETPVTVKWIAQRLHMGTWTHPNHLLHQHRHKS